MSEEGYPDDYPLPEWGSLHVTPDHRKLEVERSKFGMSLAQFKKEVASQVEYQTRTGGGWHLSESGGSVEMFIRVSTTNGNAVKARVVVWVDKPDRMYFSLELSRTQHRILLKDTGLKYSPTLKRLILSPAPGMVMGGGGSAAAYNYGVQSGHVHITHGAVSSMDFTMSEKNLDLAFGQVSQDIINRSHMNVAEREAQRMISNATTGHGNPDDMEAAALRLATLAQEIRQFIELEPTGDEPVITWKHRFGSAESDLDYTYVAVKLGTRWYVTGDKQVGKTFSWRDFLSLDWAKSLTTGDFLLVTEWTQVGGN